MSVWWLLSRVWWLLFRVLGLLFWVLGLLLRASYVRPDPVAVEEPVAVDEPVVVDERVVVNEPYKHERLQRPTTIRLIRIMPKKINGDIACAIFQADREEVPVTKYQALSYLWGNDNPTRRIYVQDNNQGWRPVALHENLWKFLDHAWRKKMFDTPFWTDRLCLDQDDHDEVSQQILLMGEIYAKADRVVVWLDIEDNDLESILQALEWDERIERHRWQFQSERHRLINEHQQHQQHQQHLKPRPRSRYSRSRSRDRYQPARYIDSQELDQMALYMAKELACKLQMSMDNELRVTSTIPSDNKPETFRHAIHLLSANDYWRRVWIVQEVVKANDVRVMSEKFSLGLIHLLYRFTEFRHDSRREAPSSMWEILDMRESDGVYPLWRLLREFADRETSRPADLVYGFLGMVADPDDGSSSVKNILVDYAKPAAHVFLDAIFESSPPLTQYGYKTHRLLRGQLGTYSCLQEYIKSSRTSQRHSGFARLTRQVWDVVEAMVVALGDVDKEDLKKASFELFQNGRWEPTLHQNGAIMGFVFASYEYGNAARQRPQNSRARPEVASAWRCAAHMHRISNQEKKKRTVARLADLRSNWYSWDTQLAATVCAEKSESCDFSTMVFDIPDVGFRLLLETDMNGCLEARWRLQLEKMKAKGAVAANDPKAESKCT